MDKINILGTEYTVLEQCESDNPKLEDCDGLCEVYSKKIVLSVIKPDKMTVENVEAYKKKVKRHEIIHAFLFESGLDANTDWARNEEIVDWIALQFPKLLKAFEAGDCLG